MSTATLDTALCLDCHQQIPYDRAALEQIEGIAGDIMRQLRPTICNSCDASRSLQEQQAIMEGRLALWKRVAGQEYSSTDPSRLPVQQLKLAEAWQYGFKGMVFVGEPRLGKTRIMWLVIKRLILDGYHPACITSGEFAAKSARLHDRDEQAFAWKDELTRADALFIDDFGKFKITERVEADLFDVVESMNSQQKPILLTTNGTSATLLKQFQSEDRGGAILARIREFCSVVMFLPKPQDQ